jgi:hypothetical protein
MSCLIPSHLQNVQNYTLLRAKYINFMGDVLWKLDDVHRMIYNTWHIVFDLKFTSQYWQHIMYSACTFFSILYDILIDIACRCDMLDIRTGDCVSINRELRPTAAYLLVTFANKCNINCINWSIRMKCLRMGHWKLLTLEGTN